VTSKGDRQPALADDEFAVLDWFYEGGWDDESLAALRPLAGVDPGRIARLRAAVDGLRRKGLVVIAQTHDRDPEPRVLDVSEADAALSQEQSWAVHDEPLFDPDAEYFLVRPTDDAARTYEAELTLPGRGHNCDRELG
jgi:hypothetical protein